jgi:hypothetical protein
VLFGTADPAALAVGAPVMPSFDAEAVVLPSVEVLQVMYELPGALREPLLPPALHPVDPPLVQWLVWRCPESPWGPFTVAQTRIGCRSGLRPRGFLRLAVVDADAAAAALAGGWGVRARRGAVLLRRGYDAAAAEVRLDGRTVLDVGLRDPDPLAPGDVQYTASMHLATTPRGLRLVQCDPGFRVERAERGRPVLSAFDAAAWGAAGAGPTAPVSASIAVAEVTLPRLRYVCRPDVWAFEGTEALG